MMNRNALALVRQVEHCRDMSPAAPISETKPASASVQGFFDAFEIIGGGNRAKVATAMAHRLTNGEIEDAMRRLLADRDDFTEMLMEAGWDKDSAGRSASLRNEPAIKILTRVKNSRVVKK